MMRSLRMLMGNGGGGSVTLKTNNNAVLTDSNGILDINSIKLSIPNATSHNAAFGSQGGGSIAGQHKKLGSLSIIARPEEARKQTLLIRSHDDEVPKNNLNVEDFENNQQDMSNEKE